MGLLMMTMINSQSAETLRPPQHLGVIRNGCEWYLDLDRKEGDDYQFRYDIASEHALE